MRTLDLVWLQRCWRGCQRRASACSAASRSIRFLSFADRAAASCAFASWSACTCHSREHEQRLQMTVLLFVNVLHAHRADANTIIDTGYNTNSGAQRVN